MHLSTLISIHEYNFINPYFISTCNLIDLFCVTPLLGAAVNDNIDKIFY